MRAVRIRFLYFNSTLLRLESQNITANYILLRTQMPPVHVTHGLVTCSVFVLVMCTEKKKKTSANTTAHRPRWLDIVAIYAVYD